MNKYKVTLADGKTEVEVIAHGITPTTAYYGSGAAPSSNPLHFFDYEKPFKFPVEDKDDDESVNVTGDAVEYDEFGEPYDFQPLGGRSGHIYPVQMIHTIFAAGTWVRVVRTERGVDD